MLITTTALNGTGPETIALGAGVIRRVRYLALSPYITTAAGTRTITASNIRVDSGGTATLGFASAANSGGIQFQFSVNDGLDVAIDQPSTFTFSAGTSSSYTCVVGYDRVT